jgi:hypothetical protein
MKRPVVIEAAHRADGSPGVYFRFVCASCGVEGAWHSSLNDAERSGERHNRVKHADEAVARA